MCKLYNRTVTIGLRSTRSESFGMSNKGTPQGSILSPLLFNIGMRKLAIELGEEKDLGYAIYADDTMI